MKGVLYFRFAPRLAWLPVSSHCNAAVTACSKATVELGVVRLTAGAMTKTHRSMIDYWMRLQMRTRGRAGGLEGVVTSLRILIIAIQLQTRNSQSKPDLRELGARVQRWKAGSGLGIRRAPLGVPSYPQQIIQPHPWSTMQMYNTYRSEHNMPRVPCPPPQILQKQHRL